MVSAPSASAEKPETTLAEHRAIQEAELILATLRATPTKTQAAAHLGMSERTLRYKLARLRRYSDTVTRSCLALARIRRASRSVTLNVSVVIGNIVIPTTNVDKQGHCSVRPAGRHAREPAAGVESGA